MQLRHWQGDVICDMLRLGANGRRLYTIYELFIARKNSKSLIGAGLALDGLFDEEGAEVYSCAGSREQAGLVFSEVASAVKMSPELSSLLKVYDGRNHKVIECPSMGSVYKALSSDSALQEGLNPSRVIFDEKHAQKSDDLWDVMTQGSDTREQPLVVTITTKGVPTYTDGTPTICKRGYDYAKKVMSGEVEDPSYGCRIYESVLKDGDDWRDPKHWPASNPALGDFLHLSLMKDQAKRTTESNFKAKRLNIWVNSALTWLPTGKFEKLAAPRRKPIPGEAAVIAFDGSFRNDSTAIVAWLLGGAKPHLTLLAVWEKPEKAVDWLVPVSEVKQLLPALYRGTPIGLGGKVEGRSLGLRWDLALQEGIVFDPARWLDVFRQLDEDGVPVVEFPNNSTRMVPATELFYQATINGDYTHDGHPALIRHANNATTKLTSQGTMLDKKAARAHIDLIVAAVMGYPIATHVDNTPPAVSINSDPGAAVGANPFRGHGRLKI